MLSLRRTLVRLAQYSAYSAKYFFVLFFLMIVNCVAAQDSTSTFTSDTASLNAVTVTAFSSGYKWKDVPASVAILNKQQLMKFDGTSMIPIFNTVAGVRMEERSPGSYRLSVRGSLLRSPFGVRNIKIYLDDIPFTDATGNTYLNLIDLNELSSVEIIKGPSSSFYGANTGGAVILNTDDKRGIDGGLSGGSYGLFKEYVSVKQHTDNLSLGLQQSHTQNDGYRQQSALRRDVVQARLNWKINKISSLSFLGIYANLHYETPGGITQKQMDSLPILARQPAGSTPGAVQQNAGVYNTTLLGALTYKLAISKAINNITSVGFNHTDFVNPFITTYEKRREINFSGRTNFQYKLDKGTDFSLKANLGGEVQYNNSFIRNYDNNGGKIGNVQYQDRVHTTQYFVFAQLNITKNKWLFQAGLSNNNLQYWYNRITDSIGSYPVIKKTGNTLSPRFGLTYTISKNVSIYASVAKGFSPPTLAEVLPSSGVFTQTLQAEYGWNYEAGFKGSIINNRFEYSASVYAFALKNAIVRRVDDNGLEYFVNAGGTIQKGIEIWFNTNLIGNNSKFIRSLNVWNSFSYQPYKFASYKSGSDDYSGNKLTGVPRAIDVSGFDLKFQHNFYVSVTFNYTSSIQLNDANTVAAKPYHLLQAKIGKDISFKKVQLKLFAGADNILNEVYSLGNDINAFGGRYFNPASARNYYAGVSINL